ncbi:uncharacterized protein LOC134671551 [Cydia fagiglandana]|uniref:uncharacterized protein LOC134671551 n=1 Tax=Cydia fagiglandana TaxID=1458189 RepID=UPI002FEDEFD9
MTSDESKNNVKTLFFICNSFVFASGWMSFASGVGSIVIMGVSVASVVELVVGVVIVLVAFYGYCGAALEHRKSLKSYSTSMTFLAVSGIIHLVRTKPAARAAGLGRDDMSDDENSFIGLIFVVILALVSMLLGWVLVDLVPKEPEEVKEADIPTKDTPTVV